MFRFRLQTVLELRLNQCEAAEQAYLLAKSKRVAAEFDRQSVEALLADQRRINPAQFADRLATIAYLDRLGDQVRSIQSTIGVLQSEEDRAMAVWIEAKREVKTIEKLREKALAEFNLEQQRKEQAELDEWATLRSGRAA
jgi:flagellar FliJ protein